MSWFSFVAGATCVELDINGNGSTEVVVYATCTGTTASNPLTSDYQVMCFDGDGDGIWANYPQTTPLTVGATYYVRIFMDVTGSLTICGSNVTPTNDYCAGATAIGSVPVTDNNACHTSTGEVAAATPANLCASTLENIAWYTYAVATTGTSSVSITGIACDNGNGNNNSGFQIGFFTGTCGSLTNIGCTSSTGGTVSVPSLPAGTQVYIAIDGVSGSNCEYTISATNAVQTVLPINLKNFEAYDDKERNIIRWTTLSETNNKYQVIERSADGLRNWIEVSRVKGSNTQNEQIYEVIDYQPYNTSFYRIKSEDFDGKTDYSRVVSLTKKPRYSLNIDRLSPSIIENYLEVQLSANENSNASYAIYDMTGQTVVAGNFQLNYGQNTLTLNTEKLAKGIYFFVANAGSATQNKKFIVSK